MTPDDVPAVLAVQGPGAVIGLAEVFPQDEFPFPGDAIAQRWHEEIRTPGIDCLVVTQDDEVIGFAAVRTDVFLHCGSAVDHWGTGAAGAAHDAVLDRMRSTGVARAWLCVFTGNQRGRRFYERLGWMPTGERTRSAFPPQPELLRYERDLGDPTSPPAERAPR